METDWRWYNFINKMNIICDTSFLMILCYEPIKNMNFLEFKFGKPIFLIHPLLVKELTQIKQKGNIKRSKIANLALEIIDKEIINKNFKYNIYFFFFFYINKIKKIKKKKKKKKNIKKKKKKKKKKNFNSLKITFP